MAIKKIIAVPNPILRQKSKPVEKIDKKIKQLIKDLADTVKAQRNPRGAGLSAIQIGKPWRIFVLYKNKKISSFINPKIIWRAKETLADKLPEKKQFMEGCLSVPGYWGFVNRPYKIKLEYLDLAGQKKTAEYEGIQASYVQHEIDHSDGILFVERILEQGGKLYKLEKDRQGKDVFVEVEIV